MPHSDFHKILVCFQVLSGDPGRPKLHDNERNGLGNLRLRREYRLLCVPLLPMIVQYRILHVHVVVHGAAAGSCTTVLGIENAP